MKKTLTSFQRQALQIINDHPGIGADGFYEAMWNRHSNRDRRKSAGSYVGKLKKKGWVKDVLDPSATIWVSAYALTEEGRKLLNDSKSVASR